MAASATQSTIRGSRKLYTDLFGEQTPPAELNTSDIKESRNECLVDYFYYMGRKKILVNGKEVSMKYDDLVKITASTFFLAPHTVFNILNVSGYQIAMVKQQLREYSQADLQKLFQQKWPQFYWA